MAYNPQSNQYDFSPNSGIPFDVATSFERDLLDGSTAELGVGSLIRRSIATNVLVYEPWRTSFDTMSQIFGSLETTPTTRHEWTEEDVLHEYETDGVLEDSADVVNNVSTGNYSPQSAARFVIPSSDKGIFKKWDKVRYETSSGWEWAIVTSVDDSGSNGELNIESEDGSNLTEAAADDANVERISTNLPQDLDYDPQPRQTNPTLYETYVENYRKEIKMTRQMRDINSAGGTVVDLVASYEDQLSQNFRTDREANTLLGSGTQTIKSFSSGDKMYFSNGLYYQIRNENLHTSDMKTSGQFDADKFKNAVEQFVLYNFGGETGGPQQRDLYVDPLMASYFDRGWTDIQRFTGEEFVAGVKVRRYSDTNGTMDVIRVPMFSERHPLKNASIRNGSDQKGIGMLVPMDGDHIVRVQQEGWGPQQTVFKQKGGDRTMFQRIESKEGLINKLSEHSGVLEEQ